MLLSTKKKDYPELNNWIQEDKNPDDSWLKNKKLKSSINTVIF